LVQVSAGKSEPGVVDREKGGALGLSYRCPVQKIDESITKIPAFPDRVSRGVEVELLSDGDWGVSWISINRGGAPG
jgi:hypothetical protein